MIREENAKKSLNEHEVCEDDPSRIEDIMHRSDHCKWNCFRLARNRSVLFVLRNIFYVPSFYKESSKQRVPLR